MPTDHLYHALREPAELVIRDAHVLDPRTGLDEARDIVIRDGQIAELTAPNAAPAHGDVIEASGKHAFPAFVDPHVHLRTPGQEYKENIASGTAAAAAGGFCTVIAMPNTAPIVDEAAVLRSLTDTASRASPLASWHRSPAGSRGRSSPRWRSSATRVRSGSPMTANRSPRRGYSA